jgi:hypothetical protein
MASTVTDLVVLAQDPVHGGDRTQVDTFVEELGVDGCRRLVRRARTSSIPPTELVERDTEISLASASRAFQSSSSTPLIGLPMRAFK